MRHSDSSLTIVLDGEYRDGQLVGFKAMYTPEEYATKLHRENVERRLDNIEAKVDRLSALIERLQSGDH